MPIPDVEPLSDSECKRYDSASRRREVRLILGGRMKPSEAVELREFFQSAVKI
jgi:hypothetical protein